VSAVDLGIDRLGAAAGALLGCRIDAIEQVSAGRNSRVYRVMAEGATYALKRYPPRDDDPRDRLGTEAAALALMHRHRIGAVPRILAVDPERGFVLLSWLEGAPVVDVSESDIDAVAAFLAKLHALRGTDELPPDHLASEACLSGAEIVRQIDMRLARLRALPAAEHDLHAFLDRPFASALEKTKSQISRLRPRIDLAAELPSDRRSLVPSDFGFHNSLRSADGSLVFFDFEYFGWDDPVKMTADVMLHPGIALAPALRRRFRAAAERLYGDDPWFGRRLTAYYPLFGLRWVLILLNAFLPNRWRPELAAAAESWDTAKQRQLAKARAFLADLGNENDGRTYGE
jgi:fructosamine-3-kinase